MKVFICSDMIPTDATRGGIMSNFLDFEEIKARVSIEDAVKLCNLTMTKKGEQLRAQCPACEGSKERSLVVTPAKGVFYCFTAKTGGDQIALVSHLKGLPAKDSAKFLNGTVPEEKPKAEKPSVGFKQLDYLQPEHDAVVALGLDPDVAQALASDTHRVVSSKIPSLFQ